MLRVTTAVVCAAAFAAAAPMSLAGRDGEDEIPFEEAKLFFELNDTDGDLGIHALIDGEPWMRLEIEDPNERRMLLVWVDGRLRRQGLTEVFFESAEPPFDELSPKKFFHRFPAGKYEIEGTTLDGRELESIVELTHVMPAPAGEIFVSGTEVVLESVDCDDETTIPQIGAGPVVIAWAPVTMSHPDPQGGGAGVQPPVPITIKNYEVVVEAQRQLNGEEFTSVLSLILPPSRTSITIPEDFLGEGGQFKYEILAREESDNQTAVESCFITGE
jgi:hypothetical protein